MGTPFFGLLNLWSRALCRVRLVCDMSTGRSWGAILKRRLFFTQNVMIDHEDGVLRTICMQVDVGLAAVERRFRIREARLNARSGVQIGRS